MIADTENTVKGRLFIHAPNIHQGGGRHLLLAIIEELSNFNSTILLVDMRMPLPEDVSEKILTVKKVPPTILQRAGAERWLKQNVRSNDTVLCLGNLPPLFKLLGKTFVFVQNRYLIDHVELGALPFRSRLRITVERFWFSRNVANVNEFIVQTETMKKLVSAEVGYSVPVRILPFSEDLRARVNSAPKFPPGLEGFDFVYVASGEAHKNHRVLVEAWSLLGVEGLFPSLCLTLSNTQFDDLCRDIEKICERDGLKIVNVGELTREELVTLYKKSGALVYPSNLESFGLPLVEAKQMGLPVIASELDYVRDLLDPAQTFDPQSAVSIARAVKRFMKIAAPRLPLLTAREFIEQILSIDSKPRACLPFD